MEEKEEYKIIDFKSTVYDKRYAIADKSGKIVDDAQGYGYKSKQKAAKFIWYKFKGGRDKLNKQKNDYKKWSSENEIIIESLRECVEINFKEMSRGEVKIDDIISMLEDKYKVDIPKFVKKEFFK